MAFQIRIRGQVQGVGFRPFIWQLAQRFGIEGDVRNDAEGVLIRCVCVDDGFLNAIRAETPQLARIDAVEVSEIDAALGKGFTIAQSGAKGAETRVTPDAATCPDCVTEIRSAGRRHGYAFTNCTHCGPRFTILKQLPYDRAQTSMATFDMCDDCAAEYGNPADRRFHAQPIACPACGPHVLIEPAAVDPIADAARRLLDGQIIAIKGLGGFHLCCDATNPDAIAELRRRKHRPTKPLALMGPIDVIETYARISDSARELISDPAAPIVLLNKAAPLPDGLAPGQTQLGWMLPYTPLHHLILDAIQRPLVMTSGNLSGEPQVIGNDEAREKLGQFADAFVMHNRDIQRRLDDSVERADPPMVLRRARGRVPGTFPLPPGFEQSKPIIAYGGQMKSAICLTKNGQALLGHHMGDLDDLLCGIEFEKAVADYSALFDHSPAFAAVDAHAGYRSTQFAQTQSVEQIEVWHHHAHMAACMGENLWPLDGGKVVGLIMDGTGLGPDGTLWGGEILLGDYRGFDHMGGLSPAPLAGGDMAAREPWRNAMVRLDQAGLSDWADNLFPNAPRDILRHAVAKGLNAPMSSSAGRLFDAVAAVLGICPMGQSFEGEAAMRLEALIDPAEKHGYAFRVSNRQIDPAPIWQQINDDLRADTSREKIAARFHLGLAKVFAAQARDLVQSGQAQAIALSGGCFQNAALLQMVCNALDDLPVLIHRRIPANDGGLAFGQAMIAAAKTI
ncbi:carbamoyltransferase HypF [Marivivens niveibacter]|uniref:Carbamoyltransferase HypF n=1 Tax=Marivivens niveibacter TaxID=1930667 RepID=A0A251X0N4_9RHOB|nr:carbamoyltransferase HypF [Marivivens niveibacter]OUD10247.1 carbamoyltransferase HypF [Marivivens niveibacter]